MKIDMSYAEMSLLRSLVQRKKMNLWRELWLPRAKDMNEAEINKLYKDVMDKPVRMTDTGKLLSGPVCGEVDCCNLLLARFQEKEKEIQKALSS